MKPGEPPWQCWCGPVAMLQTRPVVRGYPGSGWYGTWSNTAPHPWYGSGTIITVIPHCTTAGVPLYHCRCPSVPLSGSFSGSFSAVLGHFQAVLGHFQLKFPENSVKFRKFSKMSDFPRVPDGGWQVHHGPLSSVGAFQHFVQKTTKMSLFCHKVQWAKPLSNPRGFSSFSSKQEKPEMQKCHFCTVRNDPFRIYKTAHFSRKDAVLRLGCVKTAESHCFYENGPLFDYFSTTFREFVTFWPF